MDGQDSKTPNRDISEESAVERLYRAIPIVEKLKGRLPTPKEISDLISEYGYEFAATVFTRAVNESELHGEFAKEVRLFDLKKWQAKKNLAARFEVTVVASNLYQSSQRWGSHVETWRRWARSMGFTTDVIETSPRASVAQNARVISDHLLENPHPHRILVTYGQGASEVRYLFQRRLERVEKNSSAGQRENQTGSELGSLRAWLNICGSFGGASSSEYMLRNPLARVYHSAAMRMKGRNPLVLKETSPTFPLWRKAAQVPTETLIASVVGIPLGLQVPVELRDFQKVLSRNKLSDGAVSVFESWAHPGLLVPVAGLSHRADNHLLEPVFKRLLAVTAEIMSANLEVDQPTSDLLIHDVSKD